MTSIQKIQAMYNRFGKTEGQICKYCSNLIKIDQYSHTFYKCKCFGETGSSATDFPVKNMACGMFNNSLGCTPVFFELERHRVKNKYIELQEEKLFEVEG